MKRGIDIIRALLDGDESEQIERFWAVHALRGEPDSSLRDDGPRGRREAWLEWKIREYPLFVAERQRMATEVRVLAVGAAAQRRFAQKT